MLRTLRTPLLLSVFIATGVYAATVRRSDDAGVQSLDITVQQQGHLLQQQAAVIQQQSAQLQALQDKVTTLETKQASQEKKAAFSVTFTGSHPLNIGDNAAVKFDNVVTNIGNGYDPITGVFTAPHSGVYALFASLRSDNTHRYITVGIFKDNTWLATATGDGSSDAYDKGYAFVTAHLDEGERVYMKHTGGDTYLESSVLTTFSGVLVSPE